MRAIMIDDEAHCHDELKDLLKEQHPDVAILAQGDSVKQGITLINAHHPDLVFLDVEMGDGTGFDLLEQIGRTDFNLIFVTAHNEYAQMAIRAGAIDYLLKPIKEANLREAIQRAKVKMEEKLSQEQKEKDLRDQIQVLLDTFKDLKIYKRLPTRMTINNLEGIHYIEVKHIVRLEAHQNYTEFTLRDGTKLLSSLNIGEYVDHFEPYPGFERTHRSHVVNLRYVKKFIRGESVVVMEDGSTISVSRGYREKLLTALKAF